jgi:hypothetical protein
MKDLHLPPPSDRSVVVTEPRVKADFEFHFVAKREEALEVYEASLRKNSELRPWLRLCLIGLGLLWLTGGLANLTGIVSSEPMWRAIVFGVCGWAIVWSLCLKPMLERQRIRACFPVSQKLVLEFDSSGIRILYVDKDNYVLSWSEVSGVLFSDEGVLIGFTNGLVHVVPKRVFQSADHRRLFFGFLKRMVSEALFREE